MRRKCGSHWLIGVVGVVGVFIVGGFLFVPSTSTQEEVATDEEVLEVKVPFYSFLEATSLEHGVEPAVIKAMILTEVGTGLPRKPISYNPKDHGMAQINEVLFPQMKVWIGEHFDPYSPEHAVLACVKQIQWLLQRPSIDESNIALAYNMGATAVRNGRKPNHISQKHHHRFYAFLEEIRKNPSKYIDLFNTVEDWEFSF